jgi:aminoglycoside phosphotransferase (APT) family kinase protein/deoxycytidylate deaminase
MFEAPILNEISADEYHEIIRLAEPEIHQNHSIKSIRRFFRLFGNWTYKVDFENPETSPIVIRCYQVYRAANRFIAETQAIDLLTHQSEVPVPQIIRASTETNHPNQYYAVMRYLPGCRLQENLHLLSELQSRRIGEQLGQYLAQIHSIKCQGYGELSDSETQGLVSEMLYTKGIFDHLLYEAKQTAILGQDEIAWLENEFQKKVFLLDEIVPSLIHGDMIDANILIQDSGEAISGILDFEHSKAWSAEVDFTKILLRFRENPNIIKHLLETYFIFFGRTDQASIDRFYARLELFQLIIDLQLVVDLAKSDLGFFSKLLTGSRHLPYLQYQRLMSTIHRPMEIDAQDEKTDLKFLRQAKTVSLKSVCKGVKPSGALIVRGNTVISSGYDECFDALKDIHIPEIPAELGALLMALRNEQNVSGGTLYLTATTSFTSLITLHRAGIVRVVFIGNAPTQTVFDAFAQLGLELCSFNKQQFEEAL